MTYTIPSYIVRPGSVYQPGPGAVPLNVKSDARFIGAAYPNLYPFDSTKLLDQSPLHLGTRRAGQQGRCYNGDGTDDSVDLGTDYLGTGDVTLAAWVKPDSFGLAGEGRIIDNGKIILFVSSTSNRLRFTSDGGSNQARADNVIVIGQWKHVAVVRVGSVATIYVNGIDVTATSNSGTPVIASSNLTMLNNAALSRSFDGGIFDCRVYSRALTSSEISYIHTFGVSGVNPTNATLEAQYKCDEQDGTTSYDSSGNGNNGTITNATLANFHATQDVYSFQNQVGYNLSGAVFIPRDESDPTNDVLGSPLTYTGTRPNDAALINSSCLTADGTLYIAAAHLAGTETVVRSGGTSTPSISAGRIDFTAGNCWDLLLSDGTYYPLADCWGTAISNAAVDGDDGVLTNATLASAFGATQDDFHYNILNGFSLYEHASTAAIRVPFVDGSPRSFTPPAGYTLTAHYPVGNFRIPAETEFNFNPDSTPEMGGQLGSYTVPAAHAFSDDIDPGATDQGFARQTASKEDRFAIFAEAQTGGNLTTIERWTT